MYKVEIMTECGDGSKFDEIAKDAEIRLINACSKTSSGVEKIIELADMGSYRDYFAQMIINKKVKRSQVKSYIHVIL